MNRKKQLINEIADLVLDKLDEGSGIGDRINHAFSYAKSRWVLLNDKAFDFLSIVQDIERNEVLAKIIMTRIQDRDYSSAYRTATQLYEIITEAFKEIGFVPEWVKPPQAKYKTYEEVERLSHSLWRGMENFVKMIKDGRRRRLDWEERDADIIVWQLSTIISILETLKAKNK